MVLIYKELKMNKFLILAIILILWKPELSAQNSVEEVLLQIEQNNTGLKSAKLKMQTTVLQHKTELYPEDPVAGINYLWGSPAETGNRQDFSIIQHVDFPTAYRFRKNILEVRNNQTELSFQEDRRQLLLKVRLLLMDMIYVNGMYAESQIRYNQTRELLEAVKAKYKAGDCSILDYHKAELNAALYQDEFLDWENEQKVLQTQLDGLNNGVTIPFTQREYPRQMLVSDFSSWYVQAERSNPAIAILGRETEIGYYQQRLSKSLALPGFSVGYMREQVVGQQFQGLTIGLNIPLWGTANRIKLARNTTLFSESLFQDARRVYFSQLKSLHERTLSLQQRLINLQEKQSLYSNSTLLFKAYRSGEISLTDYLLELRFSYEYTEKINKTERDLNKAIAELYQYQ